MARKNRFMQEDEENELEPGTILTSTQVPEPPKEEEKPQAEPDPQPSEPEPEEKKPVVEDILADLIPQKKKPEQDTFGFYIDVAVHDELVRRGEANNISKSKYLNALLRRVLFGE